ncbi:hypothetical protein ACFPPC_16520, partial [Bosea vestrisii]
ICEISRLRQRNQRLTWRMWDQVNLKAELEVRHLHEKIDHLITRQWQRLAEIQQVQLELLQEAQVPRRKPKRRKKPVAKKKIVAVPAEAPEPDSAA